eukprot:688121-Amphidinium_carterae.1
MSRHSKEAPQREHAKSVRTSLAAKQLEYFTCSWSMLVKMPGASGCLGRGRPETSKCQVYTTGNSAQEHKHQELWTHQITAAKPFLT